MLQGHHGQIQHYLLENVAPRDGTQVLVYVKNGLYHLNEMFEPKHGHF